MPELPDLEHIVAILNDEFAQLRISEIEVLNPIIFRVLVSKPLDDILPGKVVQSFRRHGPFVIINLSDDLFIVVHPMLAGRFYIEQDKTGKNTAYCLRVRFDAGKSLVYHDSKQMGKIYILRKEDLDQIPRFATQGVDVLSADFTEAFFLNAIANTRKQVRVFLMEQETVSAIGNAYADEILFAAGIHPKTFSYQLDAGQQKTLYRAVNEVMAWGIEMVKNAGKPLQDKVRTHMKVRNRQGEPCPVCGTTIRKAGVRGYDAFFCPKCQPPQRSQFIDWSIQNAGG